jgi:hypothetical protein
MQLESELQFLQKSATGPILSQMNPIHIPQHYSL